MIRRLLSIDFPAAETTPSGGWRRALLVASGLAVLTIFLYWPAVDFRLLSFDDTYYTQNDLIQGGWNRTNILRAFTRIPEENLFIPLSQLSLMTDVELFGNAPRGFHLTNILLHAANMAILFLVLWRMTGSCWKSAAAAALVAFHPLRVESVAWVTERKGVLSFLFLLLTMASYLRYAREGRWRWYAAAILCTVFGMLAKPILITLPFLLLLLDFWPLGRFRGTPGETASSPARRRILGRIAEKVPFAALSVLTSLVTLRLQSKMSLHPDVSILSRLEHSFSSVYVYLFQTAWPLDLAFRYFQTPWERFSGTFLPAAAGLVIVTGIVVRYSASRPYLLFGWFWYLVSLFPVSGIVPTGVQWISDRFTYVPHVGLAVAVVWLGAALSSRLPRRAIAGLAVLLLVPLAILSRRQLFLWKDGATLFGRGLAANAQDPRYIAQYAAELTNQGDLPRAKEQLEHVLRFATDPGIGVNVQLNSLRIYDRLSDRKGAIAQAQSYLREDPRFWRTRLHLADDLFAEKRFAEAAAEYRQVVEAGRIPAFDRGYALEGLGLSLSRTGKLDEASASYEEGLRSNPASVSLHYNLARLLADRGEMGNALAHFENALRIAPGNVRVRLALADLQAKVGAIEAAAFQFREVARFFPGTAEALLGEGRIIETAGMHAQARSFYENALKARAILPETPEAVSQRLEKLP